MRRPAARRRRGILDALEPGLGVDVGERADVEVAVQRGERNGATDVRHDPRLVVPRLHARGEVDRGGRLRHAVAVVGLDRRIVDHRGGPDLAEVEVRVDERFRGESLAGVDDGAGFAADAVGDRRDAAGGDGDVGDRSVAQPRAADEEVMARAHVGGREAATIAVRLRPGPAPGLECGAAGIPPAGGGRAMLRQLSAAALAAAFAQGALAQAGYPSRTITMVVGFAPGGGTDTVARIVAPKLAAQLGTAVVVENRAGAGGNVATEYVARAAPDGYTILLGNVGSLAVAPHLVAKLPYDTLRDLAPITMAVVFANVLVVDPKLPIARLADFVKYAKEKPGATSYGSSGIGGAGHLAGELFKQVAGIDIVHVPYKGGGPAMQGLLGGQVQAIFATPASAVGQIKAGRIRAIATTGTARSPELPEVPTIAESGYPGYEALNWYAYLAPAATPRPIIERLNAELVRALEAPDVREQLLRQGAEAQPGTPEALRKHIERELATWGRVVKEAKIEVN